MKDALGAVQSVLVLGGSSDIAQATVTRLAGGRAKTIVLAGRDPAALTQPAAALERAGATTVDTVAFDALDFASHAGFIETVFNKFDGFDAVLLAFGLLGDQDQDAADAAAAVNVVQSNYTGAVSVLLPLAKKMRAQGRGTIVVLSSVAGERARAANFIYGSSKAGLDAFCQGLGDSLAGSGVSVMVVRPGFVKTKMTAHMDDKPLSSTADEVAEVIVEGIRRGDQIVWAPRKLRLIFTVFRHLPRPIFRRIKG